MQKQKINIRVYHPKWSDNGKECNFIPKGMKKLIIGTMPPKKLCVNKKGIKIYDNHKNQNVDFFYGSSKNKLWRILSNISKNKDILYNKDYVKIKDNYKDYLVGIRKKFSKEYHIGFVDVIESCIHNEDSSKDSDLLSIKSNKTLLKILKKCPQVEIFCTSKDTLNLLKIYFIKKIKAKEKDNYEVKFRGISKDF